MNNPEAYISYFRNLAAKHTPSCSFFIMDINEVLEAIRTNIWYPALILINYNGFLKMNNADNPINTVNAGFIVIKNVQDIDSFNYETAALYNTWNIGCDILSRMVHDKASCNPSLEGFDLSSVKYEMMGPVFDNSFGFMFTWKVDVAFPITFNKSIWDDYK